MRKFRRLLSVLAIVAMFASMSTIVSAEQRALDELENLPYSDSIVYTPDGKVDAAYYENLQQKLISEFAYSNKRTISKSGLQREIQLNAVHNTIPGDVYVSFSGTTSGIDFALVGHASLVETSGGVWCISSWPEKDGHVNGVQYEYNYWPGRNKIYGLRVTNGTSTSRATAVSTARNYVNTTPRIPYNWNFLNKFTTSSFYCSQLVWRCWKTAGIDIDRFPYDTVVSPAELTGSNMTVLFYVNN